MEVKEIIENLKYNNENRFQKESILEARKNKEEVTRELLKELEKVANNIEYYAEKDTYIFHMYAMYLLAEFKEKRAFPIIIKIITNKKQEEVDYLLGDLITEDLRKILASTFDGNIDIIYNIVTNLELNEYIRGAAFRALDVLQNCNILSKKQIIDMIEKMLNNELKDDYSMVITDIVEYIMENKIYNKIELVRDLYKQGKVDEQLIGGYDDFIDWIYGNEEPLSEKNMIEDTIESLSGLACFQKDDADDIKDFRERLTDFIESEKNRIEEEIKETKKVGRNDPCPCGSGKKYKKCCLSKQEQTVATPADIYIQKSLQRYPKQELEKFYDEETIEIDKKIYQVLKHKAIPIWIKRNYREEARRNTKIMNEAIELIREKCKKEKINTVEEYNEKIAIHYSFEKIIEKYFEILDKAKDIDFEEIQQKKLDFILQINKVLEIDEKYKRIYLENIIDEYIEEELEDTATELINQLEIEMPEMERYLKLKIIDIYIRENKDIKETLDVLEEIIRKFGISEEIEIKEIEMYYEYALAQYDEDVKEEMRLIQVLWKLVKEFIKTKKITKEEEYDKKQQEEYSYFDILSEIEDFYQREIVTYLKQRLEFLNEAINLIEIGEDSKEILINGLVETYCYMDKESDAVELADKFIQEFPNNSNAIIIKSNIYSDKREPNYEKSIEVIEKSIKNEDMDNKHVLFSKLALLYEECGNDEKAKEYQDLAIKEDEKLPF